jgi:3-hydroxyacyl-[acyl-carrier-protein] dehydratase
LNENKIDERILELIPHRPPFLFVDRIEEISENKIRTVKKIEASEPFFKGHYPHKPIVPGVILCEAVFQTGAILISSLAGIDKSAVPVLTRVGEAKFRKIVIPGQVIEITAEIIEKISSAYFMKGAVSVDGKNALRVEFAVNIVSEGGEQQ